MKIPRKMGGESRPFFALWNRFHPPLDNVCYNSKRCENNWGGICLQRKSDTVHVIENAKQLPYALVLNGLLVGILAGGVAVIYRLLLEKGEAAMRWMLEQSHSGLAAGASWLLALAALGAVVGLLVRWEPMISGSGIPQVSGEMKGYLDPHWLRVLAAKLVGGTLCALGGLSLGREGPSVQLGGMVGKGVSRLLHRVRTEEKYLITCGAGAGHPPPHGRGHPALRLPRLPHDLLRG